MRVKYIVLGSLFLLFLFFINTNSAQSRLTKYNITTAINVTSSYIRFVNSSAYLIFYPNLTGAYSYLNLAINQSKSNMSRAYFLLDQASRSAANQLAIINQYRQVSLYALSALAIAFAASLYVLMRPHRRKIAKQKRVAR